MTNPAPQRLAHHIDRQNANERAVSFTKAFGQGTEQLMALCVEFFTQALGSRFERGEMIAVGFNEFTYALDRIYLICRAVVAAGKALRRHGLAATRFYIAAIESLHRRCDVG